MANPTTNYGFVLPTSSDLVTDLPADFDVALQGVDTRLKALNPETTLGDIAYRSATANTNTRLPIGTTGQVLAVVGGVPAWATTSDQTPLTTKGDLFTFTTEDARLGVGTNGHVLTADSAETSGLKWAAPSTGALVLVKARTAFSNVANTGTTFDNVFTSSYKNYLVVIDGLYGATGSNEPQIQMLYSGSTQTTNYYGIAGGTIWDTPTFAAISTNNGSAHNIWTDIGNTAEGNNIELWFSGVGNTSEIARWNGTGFNASNADSYFTGCKSATARTYTGFLIKSSSSNVTGFATVYGLAAA